MFLISYKTNRFNKLICFSFFCLALNFFSFAVAKISDAQNNSAITTLTEKQTNELINSVKNKTLEYRNLFKDLTCKEVKTIEDFDKKGQIEKKRQVVSNLIVYQPPSNSAYTREFRNVYEVDGKVIKDQEKRVVKLFERLSKTKDIEKELKEIDKEGLRYDLSIRYIGRTIEQVACLQNELSNLFSFEFDSVDKIGQQEVLVIKYKQIKQDKSKLDLKLSFPSEVGVTEVFWRGKLWIDSKTHQIWKEELETVAKVEKQKNFLVVSRDEFNYSPSKFGLLLPDKFIFSVFNKLTKDPSGDFLEQLNLKMTCEYSAFSKFSVTAEEKKD